MPLSSEVEELSGRIRAVLADRPEITELAMFGGVAFMLDGNMLVGPTKGGGMLVRVGKDAYDATLALPGANPMIMGDRRMTGFVQVLPDVLETEEGLASWIARAEDFVKTLPPK